MDLSALIGADVAELVEVLGEHGSEADESWVDAVSGLLADRAIHLLRASSRDEVLREAAVFEDFRNSAVGQACETQHPGGATSWPGIARLLQHAAAATDEVAVESLLRGHAGKVRALLELLAERGEPVPRAEAREHLGMSESHLSHLLREAVEIDLVRRRPDGRAVLLVLGQRGADVVRRTIRPPWIDELVDVLRSAGMPDGLAVRLAAVDAPAELVRRLRATSASPSADRTRELIEAITSTSSRAQIAYDEDRSPVGVFGKVPA